MHSQKITTAICVGCPYRLICPYKVHYGKKWFTTCPLVKTAINTNNTVSLAAANDIPLSLHQAINEHLDDRDPTWQN